MAAPQGLSGQVPIVQILESEELSAELVPQLLREINDRQWASVLQILVEAKSKAESMLRNDAVFDSPGRVAFYQGWVSYSDYIISSLQGIRAYTITQQPERQPGPE